MKHTIVTLFLCTLAAMTVMAQKSTPAPSFGDLFDQMHRQMLRGMQIDTTITLSPGKQEFFQMGPDSSSYFYFKIDTSFSGGQAMPDIFGTSPFGQNFDPFGGSDGFGDFDRMFQQMEEMQRRMWGAPPSNVPQQEPEISEDGLLPEERIRQREEGAPNQPAPKPAAPVKPKVKTIRI